VTCSYDIPHFLGIGAQKSATTWLDRCLRTHPDLWLPPVKELHYFTHRGDHGPEGVRRLFGSDHMSRRLRRLLRSRFRSDLRHLDMRSLRWDFRYFFGSPSDAWYVSLFAGNAARIVGEITPEYSKLSSEEVRRVHESFPDLKLIYIMRDPIDRTWSQIRMLARKRAWSLDNTSAEKLLELLGDPEIISRSEYVKTLDNWGRYYPDDRFFITFLEDVISDPGGLLVRLFSFLGIGSPSLLPPDHENPVNPGESRPIPPILERELARIHIKDLLTLEDRFGYPVTTWRERAERALAS